MRVKSILTGRIPSARSFSPLRSSSSKKKSSSMTTDTKTDAGVAGVTDHLSTLQAAGSWDTEELSYEKHHPEAAAAADKDGGRPSLEDDHHRGFFSSRLLHKQHKEKTHPLDWGYPGELTKEEVDCYVSVSLVSYLLSGGYAPQVLPLGDVRLPDASGLYVRWLCS